MRTVRTLITLTTDFGYQSQGLGQIRIIIVGIAAKAGIELPTVVDYAHGLPAHNLLAVARTMETLAQMDYSMFERRAHVCVVDPSVGTKQKRIIVETNQGDFLIG